MTRPESSTAFAEGENDFGLALYEQLRHGPGNLFFSPFSIRTALGMAYTGARGETASQMGRAIHFASSGATLPGTLGEIVRRLNAAGGGQYDMTVASSLWSQDGAPIQASFSDLVARLYGGLTSEVDFRGGGQAARETINRWVERETKQRIRELIPPGGLDADTRLVLVNAVSFKGAWVFPFSEDATRDGLFFLDGGEVHTPLMYQREHVRFMRAADFQAVELDYLGDDLSMLVLLPDQKDGLRDLETRLSARMLHSCVATTRVREVQLFLPRFRMTWGTVELGTHLRALGMPLAFIRSQADFSGINGHAPPSDAALFISAIFHKAFVDVSEAGTEAAAATAIGTLETGIAASEPPPIPVFRADHPFLFAIRDRKSGAILFVGRLVDPSKES